MRATVRDAVAVSLGVVLVSAAFLLPHLHAHNLAFTPLIHVSPKRFVSLAGAAPIFGWWEVHGGWGTVAAVVLGLAAVWWGPQVAQRLPWRWLTLATWLTSALWAFSLAMIDGWQRGFAGRLTAEHEYLRQVPTITDIPQALRTFASRIPDYQPHSWITHVSGHPPGALLTFVWLDRLGLGGGAWAGTLCLLAGSSAAAAVIVTLRAVSDETTARRAAPSSPWRRPPSGSPFRPTGTTPVLPRGALLRWHWPPVPAAGDPSERAPPPGWCSAGRSSSTTAWGWCRFSQ